jgi:carbonic anhydrase
MCERHQTFPMSRRRVLSRGGGLVIAGAAGLGAMAAVDLGIRDALADVDANKKVTGDQALERLMEGNARYVGGNTTPHDFAATRAGLAEGQAPFAVILGCADSRVGPEFAFDQSRGQLFVLRVAGNTLNVDNLASMEYAVEVLGSPLIMVLGHSACGAVDAAIKVVEKKTELPGHLPDLIGPITPAVEAARGQPGDLLTNAIRQNVALTVDRVASAGPLVSARVADGRVKVVGAVYDLATGKVDLVA